MHGQDAALLSLVFFVPNYQSVHFSLRLTRPFSQTNIFRLKFYFALCIVWKWCNVLDTWVHYPMNITPRVSIGPVYRHRAKFSRSVLSCSNQCCWCVVWDLGIRPPILAFSWHCRDLTIYRRIYWLSRLFKKFSYRS